MDFILALLAALGGAVIVLFRMWRGAEGRAREAERRADTHNEMRDLEQEARDASDHDLVDRLSRDD